MTVSTKINKNSTSSNNKSKKRNRPAITITLSKEAIEILHKTREQGIPMSRLVEILLNDFGKKNFPSF